MKTVAPILLVALVVAACGASLGGPAPTGPAGLAGRTFLSTAVTRGGEPMSLVPGTRVRLVFNADGNVGASAGCNSIGGQWRLDGNVLRFSGGAMTEMGCDEPRHAQDDWLAGFLAANPTVSLSGNDLSLTAGDTTVSLLDREIAEPDLPLVGTEWVVNGILSGDAVSSTPGDARAAIRIGADGQARIQFGCNEGGATVVVDGNRIQFRDITTTDMACQGPAGELERAVLAVLGADALTWSIDASGLTLMAGRDGLMLAGAADG